MPTLELALEVVAATLHLASSQSVLILYQQNESRLLSVNADPLQLLGSCQSLEHYGPWQTGA